MSNGLTYVIEAAVGLTCVAAGAGMRRRSAWLAALLAIAGLAAVAHAAWASFGAS
ncbi:MAG: hypothetical protein WD004_01175 [Actinomycetota bacterium]